MPGECVLVCERARAPVIRVTVFTFPLRRTGAQAAHWEDGGLYIVLYAHMDVYVCVCAFEWVFEGCACLCGGVGGVCAQDYCSAIILGPSQWCSHEPGGLWVLLVPTEWTGHPTFFILSPLTVPRLSHFTSEVFIDYLVLLFNNLILGDSALCSHRN